MSTWRPCPRHLLRLVPTQQDVDPAQGHHCTGIARALLLHLFLPLMRLDMINDFWKGTDDIQGI